MSVNHPENIMQRVADAVTVADPQVSVTVDQDKGILLVNGIRIPKSFLFSADEEGWSEDTITQAAKQVLSLAESQSLNAKAPRTPGERLARLFPVLRRPSLAPRADRQIVYTPWLAGLDLVLVEDLGPWIVEVKITDLPIGVTPQEAIAIATQNLSTLCLSAMASEGGLFTTVASVKTGKKIGMCTTGGAYSASMVLIPQIRRILRRTLKAPPLFAVPAFDAFFAIRPSRVKKARNIASCANDQDNMNPLTDSLFIETPDGLAVYEPPMPG